MIDRELQPHERAALRAWAEGELPDDFADEVLARWEAEQEEAPADPDAPPAIATRRSEARDVRIGWWCGMVAAAAAIMLALGLAWPQRVPDPTRAEPSSDELAALRAEARAQLVANCAPCHVGGADLAKPAAVAIFDVGDPRWHDALSPEQLVAAVDRMADRGGAAEAAGFRRYVDAELAHRSAAAR